MTNDSKDRQILGWREWIGFPELGIQQIKAKVDTGARTPCQHAFMVEPFERDGRQWVRFAIHPMQHDTVQIVRCEAPVLERRVVRDSGGHEELRFVIQAVITIGDDRLSAEVTLTDRDTMKFRALLGRTAIRGSYLVDSGRSYVRGKKRRSAAKKKRGVSS